MNKYLLYQPSRVYKDQNGNEYPDIFSLDLEKFEETRKPLTPTLTESDIYRFDIFCYEFYKTTKISLFILLINTIGLPHRLNPGEKLKLPDPVDIDNFKKRVLNE